MSVNKNKNRCVVETLESRTLLSVAPAAAGSWTVLVYLDADNNLESYGLMDLNEMEAAVLPSGVTVAVEVDRISGYDSSNGNWTDTRRGTITHDTSTSVVSSPLTSIGEKNMGDPATLTDFINWGVSSFPASHYALVMWDHGGGLYGNCWDDSSGGDNLSVAEITSALNNAKSGMETQGTHLDMVGFDTCLAGMVEQYYDLSTLKKADSSRLIDVVTASEQTIPGYGWDYTRWLNQVTTSTTAEQLGTAAVTAYSQTYNKTRNVTLSATRLSTADTLAADLNSFANTVLTTATSTDWNAIATARKNTPYFTDTYDRDVKVFMTNLVKSKSLNAGIKAAATTVINDINATVISNFSKPSGTGLSICLPDKNNPAPGLYTASNFAFLSAAPRWLDFANAVQTRASTAVASPLPQGSRAQMLFARFESPRGLWSDVPLQSDADPLA